MDLVAGPFHPDLERAFARALTARAAAEPLAVVAPSQRMADRLKEVAIAALPRGVAGVRFFNLVSFARTILDSKLPQGWSVLEDDLAAEKLVLDLVESHYASAPYLSRAGRVHRTARALLSVLHDLADAGLDPDAALSLFVEEIREALEGGEVRTLAELESPRVAEILSLYRHYRRALAERKWLDRRDVAAAAASANFRLPYARVFYYGFYELVQTQLDLLKAVCARVQVTVFYPWTEAPAWSFARPFFDEVLRPMAARVELLEPAPHGAFDLFHPERKPPALVARLWSVSGVRDEVWIAAKEVLRWRDRGARRIAVVARSLDPYLDHLEPVFAAHAIPFRSSVERPMHGDPYVKAARRLFALPERDWSREDVIDFLSSPAARRPAGANPAEWDRLSRERGVGHGVAEWRARVSGDLLEAVEAVFAVGEPPATWAGVEAWARAALDRLLGPPPPELDGALAALGRLDAVRPRPREGEPLETLRAVLDRLKRPLGGDAGVHVLDAMAARGLPFDALVLLGMNERTFPRYILQDPFLRDDVRSRIAHRLGNRLPLKSAGYEEEKLLFALLLSSAPEIVLVRRRSDDEGRLQVPSVFLSALELPKASEVPRPPRGKLELDLPLTPREASILEHFRPGAPARVRALAERRGWPVARLERAAEFLSVVSRFGPPTRFDGHVGAMPSYVRGLTERGISPTALERLATCPFQYFARQVLDLAPLEEPEAEESVDVFESGRLYHRAMELALRDGRPPEEALADACRELESERTIRYPLLWEAVQERMREALVRFAAADAGWRAEFRPALFEETVEGTISGVKFQGKVDRVDLSEDGRAFRVVDYKRRRSGKYPRSMEKGIFERKDLLQPPIYFLLVAQRYPKADLSRSTALYAFIEKDPEVLELPDDFAARREEFVAVVHEHLARIREGRFGLRVDEKHCDSCDYRWMCRKNHIPSRRRSETVP